MTPEEAHELLRQSSAPFETTFTDFIDDNDPWYEGFDAADPGRQARLRDAAELLVTTGNSHYAGHVTHAAVVLGFPMEPRRLTRLVTHYRAHGTPELPHILLYQCKRLTARDLDVLQEMFLAQPGQQLTVGKAVLLRRPEGPAWEALVATIEQSEDPVWLAAVCEFLAQTHGWAEERLSIWYAQMLAKPLRVREATAARVIARPWGLRKELGLEP